MDSLIYDLSRHLTYRIARLQARLNAQATELLKTHADISLSEWRVLAVMSNPDVTTQKDVLEAMGLDKGQVSRTLKRLETRQLIIMTSSTGDQRKRHVALSPKGQDLVQMILPIMKRRQAHLQSDLSAEEVNQLFELLNKLERKSGHLTL